MDGSSIEFDYSKLRGRIREKFHTEQDFGNAMKLSHTSLSKKLNGKVRFNHGELFKMQKLLDISDVEFSTYFFTEKVQ